MTRFDHASLKLSIVTTNNFVYVISARALSPVGAATSTQAPVVQVWPARQSAGTWQAPQCPPVQPSPARHWLAAVHVP